MLVPITLLALGALLAGRSITPSSSMPSGRRILAEAIAFSTHLAHAAHESALWVKLSPTIAMLLGLWIAWNNYIRDPKAASNFVATFPAIYKFVSNKWYFDESTTSFSCGLRCGSDGCSGAAATRGLSTASARTARLMRSMSATASPIASSRVSLFLCAGDAARADRRGELGDLVGPMNGLPLLTLLIAVPLIAGVLCLFVRAEGARWIALIATLLDLALAPGCGSPSIRTARSGSSSRRSRSAAASAGRWGSTASR